MHVLFTGATGHIGSSILTSLLTQHPHITHITTITRRPFSPPPLPTTTTKPPTHTNIVLPNFSTWPASTLTQLATADAMVWALGSNSASEEINHTYPRTFCESFLPILTSPSTPPRNRPFKFIYLSGALASPSQTQTLYFLPAARKVKGRTETFVLGFADEHKDVWETCVLRPGGVYKEGGWSECASVALPDWFRVAAEEVGAFVGGVVLKEGERGEVRDGNGEVDARVVLNERLVREGRAVLNALEQGR